MGEETGHHRTLVDVGSGRNQINKTLAWDSPFPKTVHDKAERMQVCNSEMKRKKHWLRGGHCKT